MMMSGIDRHCARIVNASRDPRNGIRELEGKKWPAIRVFNRVIGTFTAPTSDGINSERTMQSKILFRVSILASAAAILVSSSCKKTESAAGTDTASTKPTLVTGLSKMRVADIQVGRHAGPDKRVTDATTSFAPHDTMYVAVITDGAESNATLSARWMKGAALVKEMDGTITSTGGTTVTQFHVENTAGWPTGEYTVEILLDGVSAGTKTFTVK